MKTDIEIITVEALGKAARGILRARRVVAAARAKVNQNDDGAVGIGRNMINEKEEDNAVDEAKRGIDEEEARSEGRT